MVSPDNASTRSKPLLSRLPTFLALALFAALAVRQLAFVNRYAVNVLYWDQWDIYFPLFHHGSLWDVFSLQHGPHRQGIGFILTDALAHLSGWNSRWDAFGVCGVTIGATALALLLLRRAKLAFAAALAAVPLLFLNMRQYEMLVGPSNISHGAMPMALFMAYCLACFVRDFRWRYPIQAVLTFLLIFTGFGLFVGLIAPVVMATELVYAWRTRDKARRTWAAAGLLMIAASWALFAKGYRFEPAVNGFYFPYKHPIEYLYFAGLMLTNFFGVPGHGAGDIALGIGILALLLGIAIRRGLPLLKGDAAAEPLGTVIFALSSYAVIYCLFTAVGRIFLGLDAAAASRYVTLTIAAGFALLLELANLPGIRLRRTACLLYIALLIPGTVFLRADDMVSVHWFSNGRREWKAVYLKTGNEALATKESGFHIFPIPIPNRLNYLRQHHLNLFLDAKR